VHTGTLKSITLTKTCRFASGRRKKILAMEIALPMPAFPVEAAPGCAFSR
jgi:hypothetical protein